jgi:DNA-binding winged helix-turn-helix (wHTH) protein/predicted ATPase
MTPEHSVCFSSFRLDLPNQRLCGGGDPIPLRPKTFAVLRYLLEHAGRLVTREELVKAVWPDTHGAAKAPKRCILELRAALGDRADDPRFIETVGRLGYRFIAPLGRPAPSVRGSGHDLQSLLPLDRGNQAPQHVLVGRAPELAQLHRCLDTALRAERQVVFVTGEPGIGKTSLVETFLHQLETRAEPPAAADGVWIGRGQCIEHYGEGEAYLPVLEALGRLAGRPGHTALLDLLWSAAPSWLAQLPSLVTDGELEALQHRLGGATRQRMLREIADVINALTTRVALVLVIEDLHWSDPSTLDFLSSVTQHREQARLLVIATYRSAELAAGHPLRPVAQELLSHWRACEVPLAGLSPTAVEQYLDARFPQHAFPSRFAPLLHRLTEGNPLFLVDLVEHLIAQELLSHAEERWTLRVPPGALAARVPENSRRLVEKQMARLAPETQPFLEAASIAGAEFAAEAVASALETSAEDIEAHCDELARQDLFLRRLGVDEWPDGTRTTRYGFRHAMYQQLWSERVPARRQQRFHFRIGERRERSFGQRAGEIAAELAVHFDMGRDYQRAVQYRCQAAQNALQRSAHQEAIDHLNKGLESLRHLPDSPQRAEQELKMQILLGVPLTATKGYAVREVEHAYTRALKLSEEVKDTSQTVQALLGLWVFYFLRADLQTAQQLGARCLQESRNGQAADLVLDAHNALASTLLWRGELASAREHLEEGLAVHDARQHQSYLLHDATDPGVDGLSNLAWALWYLGYPDRALKKSHEALALARRLDHPYSLCYALNFAAALHCFRREKRQTRELAEGGLTLASEQGFPFWSAIGTILRGWALVEPGPGEEGLEQIRQGLIGFQAIGAELCRTAFLALLAESYATTGQAEQGLRVLAEALAAADRSGERLYEAEIHRLHGELTLQLTAGSRRRENRPASRASKASQRPEAAMREAETDFLKAIEVARGQRAKSCELRAAISLGRLWRQQEKPAVAHAMLSEIHCWFSEGFDTADLKAAKSLLRELSHEAR